MAKIPQDPKEIFPEIIDDYKGLFDDAYEIIAEEAFVVINDFLKYLLRIRWRLRHIKSSPLKKEIKY